MTISGGRSDDCQSAQGCLTTLGVFAGVVIGITAFFLLSFYTIHVRYRLTVEVQDGDQVRVGSSVIDVGYSIQPEWSWSGPSSNVDVVGYAPTVDLGKRGVLFLTFANANRTAEQIRAYKRQIVCPIDNIGCLPFAAYEKSGIVVPMNVYSLRKAPLYKLLKQSGPREVPWIVLPKLVRIGDINDPGTMAPVSPFDLAAGFGPGVELKRVVLQLTDEPVTPPPESWPQWLKTKHTYFEFRGHE